MAKHGTRPGAGPSDARIELEDFYADVIGAVGQLVPSNRHLHYGLADHRPRGLGERLRTLREGPARLLDEVARVAEIGSLAPGSRALDLGCGLAGTSLHLAEQYDLEVVGLDRTPAQIDAARLRVDAVSLPRPPALCLGEGTALPLRSACFALAVALEVAFHVADKEALFAEVARVLAPGGRFVLVDQEMRDAAAAELGLFHFAAAGAYGELAERMGLRIAEEVDLSRSVADWMDAYAWFGSRKMQVALVAFALLRGRPGLARRLVRGLRGYHRLVMEDADRQGMTVPPGMGGVQALRVHTRDCLLEGRTRYRLWVFEKR